MQKEQEGGGWRMGGSWKGKGKGWTSWQVHTEAGAFLFASKHMLCGRQQFSLDFWLISICIISWSGRREDLGFHKQATHRKCGDEPFFHSGVDRSLGMAQKWSILDQKGSNMAGLSTLQSGPKGSERDQNGQTKCFWPLGTLLGPSGPFWTISDKNDFLSQMDKVGFCRGASEQNINSCLKWSKRVQMFPFEPFWTTLQCWQACHVRSFLV